MNQVILEVKNITKSFLQPDKTRLVVLNGLSLEVPKGTIVAVTGASGSGKSTLLHLMGALEPPDAGDILMEGKSILSFNRKEQTLYRNQQVGFVFQFHYLMPELNVRENVAFPFLMKDFSKGQAYEKAEKILADVGLREKIDYMPFQLSGGERQRAAIARGLINSPDILLADEPTGNLDWQTGERVFNVFRELLKERHLTAVIVTHNEALAQLADERYHLHEGKVIRQ
ncbi:MAG: ABC transporter ATP-binding protein [Candidatus Aminicenantes bacterium]|nr:MAG: ABC transporter ATP-binding protein [Candidatus Aminicenantes bacterium]